jgi:hypothetical protein
MVQNRVIFSSVCLMVFMSMVYIFKPEILYTRDDNLKQFGIGDEKTIYPLGVIVVVLSISLFYLFSFIDIMYA